jgi:bacillithiol biosynthesis cysteine-adding enzyme BshC
VTDVTLSRIPFSQLAGFSDLFTAYCEDFERVADYYPRDWRSSKDISQAVEAAASHSRDREALVNVLREQNERWQAREGSLKNLERLADPRSVAVVTGQQVGLFTGPMYTVLKTITAIQLARRIESETGHPCVPIFWLEGEDHDFEEAASIHIPTRDGSLSTMSLEAPDRPGMVNTGPVGRIVLGSQISDLIEKVEEAIPPTEFRDGLLDTLRETYKPDSTVRDAFASLMRRLFPDEGLVFVSPDNTPLKKLLVKLYAKEIRDFSSSFARLEERTDEISNHFPPQIHPHPMNLFTLEDEGRIRLDPIDGGESFELRGLDRTVSREVLLERLEENPCRFSPNVVMRPISQDHLIPTAAYVAGPGEVSYFAQLGPVYEWAGVPMPVIYPRASVTLVEGRVRKAMEKLDLTFAELSGNTDAIIREKTLSEMDVDLEELFDRKSEVVERDLNEIRELAKALDASLIKSVESAMTGIQKQLDTIKGKLIRAAKRNHEQIGNSVEKAADGLFPGGKLQERIVSPLFFEGKYGPDLPERLIESLSLETDSHQVFDL